MSETEHDPVRSARPELDRRDSPDALRPEEDDDDTDRKLPPEDEAQAMSEPPPRR